MSQKSVNLTAAPQLVAIGEGAAMIGADHNKVKYLIGGTSSAPDALPFTVYTGSKEPMNLAPGEGLWVFGQGLATIFADNEPS